MEKVVSNYTGIGNTENKDLRVVEIVAAVAIKERTSIMTDNRKFANKKSLNSNKTLDEGMSY